ncbi:co-chaperone GroES [bacterium]|nr:co-chaperone GroES [bacterium]
MIKPLADKVVVEPLEEEEKSAGGIILPDTAKKKPQEGVVIAVGPGKVLDDGSRGAMNVKVGDKVIYAKYGGTEVTVSGKEYVILDQDSIYAIKE